MLFEDQLAALEADSKKVGTQGGDLDFALLLDGLIAEREQGITIDVAYRFFSTDRRKFIVADTPGHEQYTRNMVTGASTADAAILLVDARKGVLTQTRRHSYLCRLLGIRHVVLAVNKMDLVDYSPDVFAAIEDEYRAFASRSASGTSAASRFPRSRATTSSPSATRRAGTTGRPCWAISRRSRSITPGWRGALPHARPVGQPAPCRFPRVRRHRDERHRPAG